jgi:hypothetical protein
LIGCYSGGARSALRFPKAFASALVVDQPLRLLAKPHSGGGKRKANIQIVTWNISRSLLFSSTPLPLPLPALGLGQSASYRLTNKLRPGLKPSRAATVSTAATNEVLTLTANSCFFTGFCISISICCGHSALGLMYRLLKQKAPKRGVFLPHIKISAHKSS